ncbi:MAG: methyltransferase domain-containing protein [Acidobacteriota bacterium]
MRRTVSDFYRKAFTRLPGWLQRRLYPVDAAIREWVAEAAESAPPGAWVLDAGAGEGRFRGRFRHCRYVGLDAAVGDRSWDYSHLDVLGRLESLPFAAARFDVAIHTQVLEHVRDPRVVLQELGRVLRPGGRLFLTAPQGWPEHQVPEDYFRFTRYALRHLLESAGFVVEELEPMGGYFHYLGHRLSYLPRILFHHAPPLRRILLLPVELAAMGLFSFLLPLLCFYLDPLDRRREFTLCYRVAARKKGDSKWDCADLRAKPSLLCPSASGRKSGVP